MECSHRSRHTRGHWLGWSVVVLALTAGLVMVLWNLVVPELVELPALSYWQAATLLVLARLLLGGLNSGRGRLPEPCLRRGRDLTAHDC